MWYKDIKTWTAIIALIGFAWSGINFLIQRTTSNKLMNNDLKHLTVDVKDLKQDSKEYKVDLKNELNRIFRRLGKIDKAIVKREAICNERHKIKR